LAQRRWRNFWPPGRRTILPTFTSSRAYLPTSTAMRSVPGGSSWAFSSAAAIALLHNPALLEGEGLGPGLSPRVHKINQAEQIVAQQKTVLPGA
jgi:hypothetical protein